MELDLLFKNGILYTMEEEGKAVEALGIKDGKIVFAGCNQDADFYKSAETVDLAGQVVIPGMADSHMHLYAYCQNQTSVNLEQAKSMDEMLSLIKEKAEKTLPRNWIKGVNFDQTKFKENRFPTKKDLDQISTLHPIVIRRCCLHTIVANSMALQLAGVGQGYDGGPGGIVEFDEDGMPNGILREQSTKVFDEIIPDPLLDETEKRKILLEVLEDMSSKGITTIHTYAAKIWRYNEDINTYRELDKEGKMPVRVTVYLDELFSSEKLTKDQERDPHRLVQFGGYKLFTDGSLGSRSAALHEPYHDDPKNKGFVICSQEELNLKVLQAYEKGLQSAIHAIGDRALDITLTAIEETLRTTREKGMTEEEQSQRLPFRIIHVQMVNEELIERMKKLPLVLDIQPVFLGTDARWIEDRIGKERAKGAYAWKTLKDEGLIQTGGSDCPVESYDPIAGIFSAVARCDKNGQPAGGYGPHEKLTVYEAIELFTKNVHYATGQQKYLGTLEVGKFADLVVLDRDPFAMDEMSLKDIKVRQTYIAGKRVF
ncbi:amidohydrolase [Clostridium aminobutyricum]|uniref:Amidohydrolase n=1 Tax=Clostridium aminobutyricum TaxID=33953 RepID=A0A939IJQ0_CLOAM|nr:amidohydrolase [Clostridium aminobutyricum]MBN7773804.1 amidohydrolase [Clostridium aminobutyricum]